MEDRLTKFAHLIDAGSYTKAAQELHISQPALSAAIAKLERELKTSLLVRGARPLAPTPAGSIAYATAKDLQVCIDNLSLRLGVLKQQEITLAVGMIDSVAHTLFAADTVLRALEEGAQVSIVVNNSRYLLAALERDELDGAFMVERPKGHSKLIEQRQVGSEPLVLVCSPALAAPTRAALTAGGTVELISYDAPSTTARLIADAFAARGAKTKPVFSSTSPEIMLRLVLLGRGAAVLPYLTVRSLVRAGRLVLVGNGRPFVIARPIVLAKRRDKQLALPFARTMRQLQRELAGLAREASRPALLPK